MRVCVVPVHSVLVFCVCPCAHACVSNGDPLSGINDVIKCGNFTLQPDTLLIFHSVGSLEKLS